MTRPPASSRARGFSMIEVLVSLLIIVLGLLGLAGLQVRMQQSEFESYQRAQALVLLQDMVDRIRLHHVTTTCFQITTNPATGTPFVGTGATFVPACTVGSSADNTQANDTILEWSALLQGVAETKGGAAAGAMVGARGCVLYNVATELPDPDGAPIPGTGLYTVVVAWQGTIDTFAPTPADSCANGLYGPETRRRVVSMAFRRAALK